MTSVESAGRDGESRLGLDEIDQLDIHRARMDIYLGRGYHIIRNFLQPAQVEHTQEFWARHHNRLLPRLNKQKHFHENCPDYSVLDPQLQRHFNFFWNRPLDRFTYVAAWQMQALRNRIEGHPPSHEYLPLVRNQLREYRAASYRIVTTLQGGAIQPHVDYSLDHSRTQFSLMLSSAGEDYSSGGLTLYDKFRGGSPRNLSFEENLSAGDLVIFRYGQKHGVEAVSTPQGGRGFSRILMPQEIMQVGAGPEGRARHLVRQLKSKIRRRKPGGKAESEDLYYNEETAKLMEIAVRQGFPPQEVYFFKGLWGRFHEHQNWQNELLMGYGLQPQHQFLDIGSGIGRLAMKLVPYLQDKHYCGIDPLEKFVELSKVYVREVAGSDKDFDIVRGHDFNFSQFDRQFDFAMSHSVFTHLTLDQIERCFERLKPVMKPGGKLIFTVIFGHDREQSFVYVDNMPMTWTTHSDFSFYEELARKHGFKVELAGREGHASQHVCIATF